MSDKYHEVLHYAIFFSNLLHPEYRSRYTKVWTVLSSNLGRDNGFSLLQNRLDLLLEPAQPSVTFYTGVLPRG